MTTAALKGTFKGTGTAAMAIAHYGSNNMVAFRYATKNVAMKIAEKAFSAEGVDFPAGSFIVRMDQPYSRIADALLDYQYWAPNDPQKNPYDDTGWTFPEGFAVQAVRVTDAKVLDVAMETVTVTKP